MLLLLDGERSDRVEFDTPTIAASCGSLSEAWEDFMVNDFLY